MNHLLTLFNPFGATGLYLYPLKTLHLFSVHLIGSCFKLTYLAPIFHFSIPWKRPWRFSGGYWNGTSTRILKCFSRRQNTKYKILYFNVIFRLQLEKAVFNPPPHPSKKYYFINNSYPLLWAFVLMTYLTSVRLYLASVGLCWTTVGFNGLYWESLGLYWVTLGPCLITVFKKNYLKNLY